MYTSFENFTIFGELLKRVRLVLLISQFSNNKGRSRGNRDRSPSIIQFLDYILKILNTDHIFLREP